MRRSRRTLLRKLPKGGIGAEVGVWKGDGSRAMLRHAEPEKLYLIDPWEHQPEHVKAQFGGKSDAQEMNAIHTSVVERFSGLIDRGRVEVIRSRSSDVSGLQLDWAWIDGDHTYDAVRADLESFAHMVKPGGHLAGDDYSLGWWGNDVIRAVDEFVSEHSGRLEIIGAQHFLIKLPG